MRRFRDLPREEKQEDRPQAVEECDYRMEREGRGAVGQRGDGGIGAPIQRDSILAAAWASMSDRLSQRRRISPRVETGPSRGGAPGAAIVHQVRPVR
jgi:hypothetical protein